MSWKDFYKKRTRKYKPLPKAGEPTQLQPAEALIEWVTFHL